MNWIDVGGWAYAVVMVALWPFFFVQGRSRHGFMASWMIASAFAVFWLPWCIWARHYTTVRKRNLAVVEAQHHADVANVASVIEEVFPTQ